MSIVRPKIMEEAKITARKSLEEAYSLLNDGYDDWSVGDAIQLAKIISQDIHMTRICMKMDEIKEILNCI